MTQSCAPDPKAVKGSIQVRILRNKAAKWLVCNGPISYKCPHERASDQTRLRCLWRWCVCLQSG